jgi:hypothetical protein
VLQAPFQIAAAGRAPSFREPPVICNLNGAGEPIVIADAEEP